MRIIPYAEHRCGEGELRKGLEAVPPDRYNVLGKGAIMSPEQKLKEMGIVLPAAPAALGAYVPCVQTGNLLFLSGQLPLRDGKLAHTGRLGESVSVSDAQEDARQAVMNALSNVKAFLGDLARVTRCVKLGGYVASAPDFIEQPKVLNAASELLRDIFGDRGKHARIAVGVPVLPLNSPLEIDFIFEVKE
jgi:enamine deaminase RidA (YjgF/YER057c/UK114 family)